MSLKISKALGYAEVGTPDADAGASKLLGYAEIGQADDEVNVAKLLGYALIDLALQKRRKVMTRLNYSNAIEPQA